MIEAKLEEIRRQLLDLSRANRLLNYRTTGKRTLPIVAELPQEVYRLLVGQEQTFHFRSREEAPTPIADTFPADQTNPDLPPSGAPDESAPALPLPPIAENGSLPAWHTDRYLQTLLPGEQLQARLLHLAREAASALQEQGSNILYLTLGILNWQEPNQPSLICPAPLLFVPVELHRKNIQTRHTLRLLDDDILINPSLLELCQRRFGFELPDFDPDADIPLDSYFQSLRERIQDLPGWSFSPDIHLGLFSFSKLLMYRDLDPRIWPPAASLTAHPLILQLAGIDTPTAPTASIPDPSSLDDTIPPNDCFQVVDADSSQQAAILAAKQGLSLVIDGPPGTGKSQTITNIIAECLAEGRSVLFVSEKSAALDVVKRRLESVGLGDFVLELHSRKSSKRAVLQELQRVLTKQDPAPKVRDVEARELESIRARLNAFHRQLHTPLGQLNLSPFQALSRVVLLSSVPEATCLLPDPLSWSPRQLIDAQEKLQTLDHRLRRAGPRDTHPWRGAGIVPNTLESHHRILTTCAALQQALHNILNSAATLAHLFTPAPSSAERPENQTSSSSIVHHSSFIHPSSFPDLVSIDHLLSTAHTLLSAPKLPPASIADSYWDSLNPQLQKWLNLGHERDKRKAIWSQYAKPEAELTDWRETLRRRDAHKSSWTRFLRLSWHADSRRLRSCLLDSPLPPIEEQLRLLNALISSIEYRKIIEEESPKFSHLFPDLYTGPDSDWPALRTCAESLVAIRRLILDQSISLPAAQQILSTTDRTPLSTATHQLEQHRAALTAAFQDWLNALNTTESQWLQAPLAQADLSALLARLGPLPHHLDQLDDWSDLQSILNDCAATPLQPFIAWALRQSPSLVEDRVEHVSAHPSLASPSPKTQEAQRGDPSPAPTVCATSSLLPVPPQEPAPTPHPLPAIFLRLFYRLFLDRALSSLSALKSFRGEEHESLIHRFTQLDLHWLEASRHRLSALIAARRPDINHNAHRQSKLGILQAEIRKKARHMPLRKLFASVGDVVQSIKPCFMMSPLSVAQYLAPGGLTFDIVIFDEASQVEPADAYGAIARGRQLILVGDENQLPPTNFFARIDNNPAADDDQPLDIHVGDLESILSLGVVRLPHRCRLRWHYRSRHASLIDFSNRNFYDNALRVFPSPHTDCRELGLSFRFIENAIYKRGAGRYNPVEAQTVAHAVIDHALHSPHLSLGVGTLNLPQQQAIEDEIERLRRQSSDPRIEQFFENHEAEPFFVKNLESIQGDERDVIFLSVGFGKDSTGKLHANFGPLNLDGGWRRLNVLVTRARQRCIVFSSIHAEDINTNGSTPRGILALRNYLHVARQSSLPPVPSPAPAPDRGDAPDLSFTSDSSFTSDLAAALQQHGWTVHPEVGPAGFAVPLAIVNPHNPGRYLLGIECDGETYHQSPTARDRERLRQQVLEKLGWTIHRIWSLDWFHRRKPTLAQLLKRLDDLSAAAQPAIPPAPPPNTPEEQQGEVLASPPPSPPPPADLHEEKRKPRREEPLPEGLVEYERRPAEALGALPVAPARLAKALARLVEAESPIHIDEALHVTAEMLDTRISPRLREALDEALSLAIQSNKITRRGDFLWNPATPSPAIRYRGNDCPVTKPELIAPEEFQAAVKLVLTKELGLKPDDLVSSTLKLLGFPRSTASLRAAIEVALQQLLENSEVIPDNAGFLILNDKQEPPAKV